MRHSYATWLLEGGADIRWVKDQMGHASIAETEGTYGHLVRERHERDVDVLDSALRWGLRLPNEGGTEDSDDSSRPAASRYVPPDPVSTVSSSGIERMSVVEGKGFEPSTSALRTPRSPN
jgi:hypothetical protein